MDRRGPLLFCEVIRLIQRGLRLASYGSKALPPLTGAQVTAIDGGHFDDDLGQGLAAEAARYAKRAARALRDDPIPYLAAGLLLGIFEACGLPGIGGYLGGVALTVRKHGGGNK